MLCDISVILLWQGMYHQAEVFLREALQYNSHTFVDLYVRVNLGIVCFCTDRKEESANYYTSALKLARKLLKNDPENPGIQFGYAMTLYHWGELCEESNVAKAKKCYLQSLKILKKNAETPNVFYSKYRVMCETRLKNL